MNKNIFSHTRRILIFLSFFFLIHDVVLAEQGQTGIYALTLDQATRLAIMNNMDIQIATYDLEVAKTYSLEARSIYDTFLSAQAGYQKNKERVNSAFSANKSLTNHYQVSLSKALPTGTTVTVDQTHERSWSDSAYVPESPSYDSAIGLTIEQDLGKNFFGLQDRGSIRIADINADNFRYSSLDKIERSIVQVQEAYWDLLLKQQNLQTKQDVLAQAFDLFDLNQRKIKDRLIESPELLASQASYEQKKIDVAIAENQLSVAQNVLKFLLLIDGDITVIAKDSFLLSQVNEDLQSSLAVAFDYRRDYQQARNFIKLKGILLSMNKNNIWPDINVRASLIRNGLGGDFYESSENITRQDNPNFLAQVKVSFPLENRSARALLSRANLENAQALLELKWLERRIMTSIADQVRTCNILKEQARSQSMVADLEFKKYQELKKIFLHGRSDMDTLIRYQTQASSAHEQADLMAFRYQLALIHLRVLEGSLLNTYWP